MNVILLAFANSEESPLPSLSKEGREVYKVLSKKASEEKDWHIQYLPFATINDLTEDILLYQEKITLFLYSGHANKDSLLTEGSESNAEGIAALLGKCPNLKLVVLNGCSTKGQVKNLLKAGVPCVIATSSSIEDESATQFSIGFFLALVKRNQSILRAYEDGLAKAQTYSKEKLLETRSIDFSKVDKDEDEPVWGIYHPEGHEVNLEWKLSPELIADEVFIPNKLLLDTIWSAIECFVSTKEERKKMTELDKLDKIITELPHPISEYLRKLIAKSRPGEKEEVFYNELNFKRLQYLIFTYTTCIELIAVTLLAQIWDELSQESLSPSKPLLDYLKELFSLSSKERKSYSFLPIIRLMGQFMEDQEIEPFICDYKQINEVLQKNTPFFNACQVIESVRLNTINEQTIPQDEAKPLCIEIERQLSVILSQLGFLAKYEMTSMKDIYFIKYKHQDSPEYKLNYVELRYRPAGMDIITKTLSDSMDNASVILLNNTGDKVKFLNLSPFIIDQNSFDNKATLANLCVFQSFERIAEAFTFRYIYKPFERPLIVRKSMDYFPTIADQFNAFHELLFDETLINYEKSV